MILKIHFALLYFFFVQAFGNDCYSWEKRLFNVDIAVGTVSKQDFSGSAKLPQTKTWFFGENLGYFTRDTSEKICRDLCEQVDTCLTIVHIATLCFLYPAREIPLMSQMPNLHSIDVHGFSIQDKTDLECHETVVWTSSFLLEMNTYHSGPTLGDCGAYLTQEDLEAACEANHECVGYMMSDPSVWDAQHMIDEDAVANDRGFFPWCLKSRGNDAATPSFTEHHEFYRKPEDIECTIQGPDIEHTLSNCEQTTEGSDCLVTCKYGEHSQSVFNCRLGVWVGDLTCNDQSITPQFDMYSEEHYCKNAVIMESESLIADTMQCAYLVSQKADCSDVFHYKDTGECACVLIGDLCDPINSADSAVNVHQIVDTCFRWVERTSKFERGKASFSSFEEGTILPGGVWSQISDAGVWRFGTEPVVPGRPKSEWADVGWFAPFASLETCHEYCEQLEDCVAIVHMINTCYVYDQYSIPFSREVHSGFGDFLIEDKVLISCSEMRLSELVEENTAENVRSV